MLSERFDASRIRIAYFTMEIGIRPEIHTYSGGLGILAGDTARSAADLELPMVFVTLISRQGYLSQSIDEEGSQQEAADPWEPADWAKPLAAMVAVTIEGREVWIRPWLYELESPTGNRVPVIMLDTQVEQNDLEDRKITDRLYGGDSTHRLKQEVVLGIGGERALRALGFEISTYHLNEGHAAFLPVTLMRRFRRTSASGASNGAYAIEAVRERCVFTTHTPVEAGHDRFSYEQVTSVLGDMFELEQLRALGGDDMLNMTRLALNLSRYVNGVARQHAETTRKLFPGYRIQSVTNGVHTAQWAHPAMARLFSTLAPNWALEPESLRHIEELDNDAIWAARCEARDDLIEEVRRRSGVAFDPALPIVSFARRMTSYKRPDLLFSQMERLRAIAEKTPFQAVFAGKAHPRDEPGKALIRQISEQSRALDGNPRIVFLGGYDMSLGAKLVSGSDVWLNNPLPPMEASGTSGMKAALNGVINFSVLDGWWIEAWQEGVTGWAIDPPADNLSPEQHAAALYAKLADVILPLFHNDRAAWIWMIKQSIGKIAPVFNTTHMMRRYAAEAYLR
jgi:starch phosphorylase